MKVSDRITSSSARIDFLLVSDEEGRDRVRKYDHVAQRQHRIGPGLTWRKRWARLCSGHGPKSVLLSLCLLKTSSAAEILVMTDPNADRNKIEISTLYSDEKIPCSLPKIPCSLQKNFPACSTGRSNFVTAWLYQSSRAIGISHIRHDQAIGPDDTRQRIDGLKRGARLSQ
jgi:hypothetical protein